jgi:hypothetical protein
MKEKEGMKTFVIEEKYLKLKIIKKILGSNPKNLKLYVLAKTFFFCSKNK